MARRRTRKKQDASKSRRRMLPRFTLDLSWIKPPSAHVMKRTGLGLAWLLTIAGLTAAWILGVPKLQAFAQQHRSVDAHQVTIRFIDPPPMSAELTDMLMRTASMQVHGDPLVRDDLLAIRKALLNTGWFDSIEQVRRVQDDLIEIRAQFVRPYTVIRDHEGDHLVDMAGKLLPMSYQRGAKLKFKPIAISGVHFARPRRVGMPWEGADVAAGLGLLQMIQRQPWHHQITEIDVSSYLKDGPIKMRTDANCVIVWGGAPGEEPALEVLAAGKLERLNFLFQRHGRVDGGHQGELDITGEKAVVKRD